MGASGVVASSGMVSSREADPHDGFPPALRLRFCGDDVVFKASFIFCTTVVARGFNSTGQSFNLLARRSERSDARVNEFTLESDIFWSAARCSLNAKMKSDTVRWLSIFRLRKLAPKEAEDRKRKIAKSIFFCMKSFVCLLRVCFLWKLFKQEYLATKIFPEKLFLLNGRFFAHEVLCVLLRFWHPYFCWE